jgi:MiaB-like tRNA modifying enzyme
MSGEKIAVLTYGCTLNQADSDIIEGSIDCLGYRVSSLEEADVIIINTCTVKGPTENRIIDKIIELESRKLKTGNGKLVICGCMSANVPKLRKYTSAPIVWPGALARIGDAVEDALSGQATEYREPETKENLSRIYSKPIMRIGIAEGCTSSCNFCQTKLARPGLKSLSPQRILQIARESISKGAKEIQLTAMDTGAYGLDIGATLPDLLNCINEIEGDFFVRLGMINPDHVKKVKKDLIEAMKGDHIYKFLHIPVQSGSEKVCKEMGRKHTVAEFEEIVAQFRREIPDITIATDIIVGYPTETQNDFSRTLDLLEQIRPDVVNLSKFSAREGTVAKTLKQLHNDEIKRRSLEATDAITKVREEINRKYIGMELDVLVTEKQKDFTGRTGNYKQVVVKDYKGKLGSRVKVMITEANHGSLFAILSNS